MILTGPLERTVRYVKPITKVLLYICVKINLAVVALAEMRQRNRREEDVNESDENNSKVSIP